MAAPGAEPAGSGGPRHGIIYHALWRRLVHGEQPPSAFVELPARYGNDTPEGMTRRTLLVGGTSVAPNTFVLGIDSERDVMVVHRLVAQRGDEKELTW